MEKFENILKSDCVLCSGERHAVLCQDFKEFMIHLNMCSARRDAALELQEALDALPSTGDRNGHEDVV